MLLTPIVVFLANVALDAVREELKTFAGRGIRRIFRGAEPHPESLVPDAALLRRMHAKVIAAAVGKGVSSRKAEAIADCFVSDLTREDDSPQA